MSQEGLPERVSKFIWQHIESLEQLEVLLVMSADRDRQWTIPEIFGRIQSNAASVEQRLNRFAIEGLIAVEGPGLYRFKQNDPVVAESLSQLLSEYQQRRVRVIETIYNRKADSIQSFADAFQLKPKL